MSDGISRGGEVGGELWGQKSHFTPDIQIHPQAAFEMTITP